MHLKTRITWQIREGIKQALHSLKVVTREYTVFSTILSCLFSETSVRVTFISSINGNKLIMNFRPNYFAKCWRDIISGALDGFSRVGHIKFVHYYGNSKLFPRCSPLPISQKLVHFDEDILNFHIQI